MTTIIALANDTLSQAGHRRLDWHLLNRVVRHPEIQELLGQAHLSSRGLTHPRHDLGFELEGFDYLNLDGLVQLLCLFEALSRSGLPPMVSLPSNTSHQQALINNGFSRAARTVARLHGLRLVDWDIDEESNFVLGRPYITRFTTATELSSVQERLDRFLLSAALLKKLGIDPTSEDGWEWAPSLAHAVNEVLKNVLEWSGVESGLIALESFPGTLVRLIVADSGVGLERSLNDQRSPILGLEPLKFALLYRYFYGEEPGLFTVLQTTKRWGGEFLIRSGYSQLAMKFRPGMITDASLVDLIRKEKPTRLPFLPGVQIRVDFTIPATVTRRR